MAEQSGAAKLADEFTGKRYLDADDLADLPANVREAVIEVQGHTESLHKRVSAANRLHAVDPHHDLALDPENPADAQSEAAYRFEVVDGEIVEVRKDSHDSHVRIIHRPDLAAGEKLDPASEIEAEFRRLAAAQPEGEFEPEPEPEA